MARTESKTFQCHPNAAQGEIDFHQKFHWSLLSSQDVKTVDNSQERRGDRIYNVRHTEHYVKLTFSRDLDTPNINEIKKLEAAYHELREPSLKNTPQDSAWGCLTTVIAVIGAVVAPLGAAIILEESIGTQAALVVGGVTFIIGIVLTIVFHMSIVSPKNAAREKECARIKQENEQNLAKYTQERQRILSEVEKY